MPARSLGPAARKVQRSRASARARAAAPRRSPATKSPVPGGCCNAASMSCRALAGLCGPRVRSEGGPTLIPALHCRGQALTSQRADRLWSEAHIRVHRLHGGRLGTWARSVAGPAQSTFPLFRGDRRTMHASGESQLQAGSQCIRHRAPRGGRLIKRHRMRCGAAASCARAQPTVKSGLGQATPPTPPHCRSPARARDQEEPLRPRCAAAALRRRSRAGGRAGGPAACVRGRGCSTQSHTLPSAPTAPAGSVSLAPGRLHVSAGATEGGIQTNT